MTTCDMPHNLPSETSTTHRTTRCGREQRRSARWRRARPVVPVHLSDTFLCTSGVPVKNRPHAPVRPSPFPSLPRTPRLDLLGPPSPQLPLPLSPPPSQLRRPPYRPPPRLPATSTAPIAVPPPTPVTFPPAAASPVLSLAVVARVAREARLSLSVNPAAHGRRGSCSTGCGHRCGESARPLLCFRPRFTTTFGLSEPPNFTSLFLYRRLSLGILVLYRRVVAWGRYCTYSRITSSAGDLLVNEWYLPLIF